MKRGILFVALLAAVCFFAPPAAHSETYPTPLEAGPNIYHQAFENEKVRVAEITFNPGDKIPMHTHKEDHFVYVIEPGQLTLTYPDGQTKVVSGTAGQVMWIPAESHAGQNTGTTRFRALVVELKA